MLLLPRHLVCRDERGCISPPYLRSNSGNRSGACGPQLRTVLCLRLRRQYGQHGARPHHVGAGEGRNGERATAYALSECLHVSAWHYPATGRHSLEDTCLSSWLCGDGAGHAFAASRLSKFRPDNARDWRGDARRCAQGLAAAGARGEGYSRCQRGPTVTPDATACSAPPLPFSVEAVSAVSECRAEDNRKHGRDGRRSTLQFYPARDAGLPPVRKVCGGSARVRDGGVPKAVPPLHRRAGRILERG